MPSGSQLVRGHWPPFHLSIRMDRYFPAKAVTPVSLNFICTDRLRHVICHERIRQATRGAIKKANFFIEERKQLQYLRFDRRMTHANLLNVIRSYRFVADTAGVVKKQLLANLQTTHFRTPGAKTFDEGRLWETIRNSSADSLRHSQFFFGFFPRPVSQFDFANPY